MPSRPKNWLLLRGLVREARHWAGFAGRLAEALGCETHTLDLPGVGTENRRRAALSVPENVEDIRRRWLEISADGPWGILGSSLGGMIALHWAAAYPQDFSRLVIVNSSARNLSRPWQRFHVGFLPPMARALISSDDVVKERTALDITTNLVEDKDRLAREFARYRKDAPIRRQTFFRQIWAASRFRAPAGVEVPTLVLSSAGDRLVDPVCSTQLAERLGAEHWVHTNAGHDLPVDDPRWVGLRLRDWLGVD